MERKIIAKNGTFYLRHIPAERRYGIFNENGVEKEVPNQTKEYLEIIKHMEGNTHGLAKLIFDNSAEGKPIELPKLKL